MICVTIQNKGIKEIFDILDSHEVEMAEIRLDSCPLSREDREDLFSTTDIPLIATCRIGGAVSVQKAEELLGDAIKDGAAYVDMDLSTPPQASKRLSRLCRSEGAAIIRSFHDFNGTPSLEEMVSIIERSRRYGADITKIAVTARSRQDCQRIMDLYGKAPEGSLVAFSLGEAYSSTRLDCIEKGAPFTYAALSEEDKAAAGQMPYKTMMKALYGGRNALRCKDIQMPASKSFAQRAILAAALAEGESRLYGYTPCEDSEAALEAARKLGAGVVFDGPCLRIKGIGPVKEPLDIDSIDTGESGLLTRLLIPLLSLLGKGRFSVNGRGTLLNRPLPLAGDIMASFGVVLCPQEARKSHEVYVPLTAEGKLMPGRAEISGRGGSQIVSGLLMALPLAEQDSTIYLTDPKSIPYMFITLDILRTFGVKVDAEMEGDEEFIQTQDWSHCSGITFRIKGGQSYKAAEVELEGDWSSAAPLMAAGAVFGEVSLLGLDTSSLQADITILDILSNAGASVSEEEDGTVNVYKAPLNAFDIDLNNAPDLFPTVSVFAGFCPGESCLSGMGRLAAKESDRAQTILEMLAGLGIDAHREGDDLFISGQAWSTRLLTGNLLKGGSFSSHNDHRMVMALKFAALGAGSPVVIDNESCVAKSFPGFQGLL